MERQRQNRLFIKYKATQCRLIIKTLSFRRKLEVFFFIFIYFISPLSTFLKISPFSTRGQRGKARLVFVCCSFLVYFSVLSFLPFVSCNLRNTLCFSDHYPKDARLDTERLLRSLVFLCSISGLQVLCEYFQLVVSAAVVLSASAVPQAVTAVDVAVFLFSFDIS